MSTACFAAIDTEEWMGTLAIGSGSSAAGDSRLRHGDVIGHRYYIEDIVGEGGMGIVYSATHIELGRTVAIKVLRRSLSGDPQAVARFRSEAWAASRIRHPGIVDVLDFGVTDRGCAFLVMEHLDGSDLRSALDTMGSFSVEHAVGIVAQAAEAIAAAHESGIVHRDLKPENLFLVGRARDHVKVLDFGIAKISRSELPQGTVRDGLIGTPEYMSPEQICGGTVDGRSDIYSLGCILYELLTGTPPFAGDNVIDTLYLQSTARPDSVSERAGHAVPLLVEKVVARCLAKRPQDRYPTMSALREALIDAGAEPSAVAGEPAWLEEDDEPVDEPMMSFAFGDLHTAFGEPLQTMFQAGLIALVALIAAGLVLLLC